MKDWHVFFACLVLSCSIWLVMNLSRSASAVQTVSVLACSNLEGRSDVAEQPVQISARCRTSGFRQLALSWSDKVVKVRFSPSDLVEVDDDLYFVSSDVLSGKAGEIFGAGVSVESFTHQGASFRFARQDCRRVAVVPVSYVTFAPQYCALGKISLSADSVLVYGDPERLKDIERINTSPITLHDLRRDEHGTVGLDVPPEVRLSVQSLDYYLPVGRYIEIRSSLPVEVRNVPAGTDFAVFPPVATVVWRCSFPVRNNPEESASLYVDYHEFERSLTGKCVVRESGVPDGVISWTVDPQICECIIRTHER